MKKNRVNNLEKKRFGFFQVGAVTALALVLVAFEWSSFTMQQEEQLALVDETPLELDDIQIIKTKKKMPLKKVIKKPKPPMVKPKVVDRIKISENVKDDSNFDPDLLGENVIDSFPEQGGEEENTFRIVEIMPHFKRCKNLLNKEKQGMCTDEKILRHVGSKIKYPSRAKRLGQSGTVHVTYVVDKQGYVRDAYVERPLFPDLDEEALRVVNSIPQMEPGMQRGRPVNVLFTIPITYTLK